MRTIFFLAVILLMACHADTGKPTAGSSPGTDTIPRPVGYTHATSRDSIGFYFADSLVVKNTGKNYQCAINLTTTDTGSAFQLAVYTQRTGQLFLYDLNRKALTDTINLWLGLHKERADFYVDQQKNIYALRHHNDGDIEVFNAAGRLQKTISIPDSDAVQKCRVSVMVAQLPFRIGKGGKIVCINQPYLAMYVKEDRERFYRSTILGCIGITAKGDSAKLIKNFLSFPQAYRNAYIQEDYPKVDYISENKVAAIFSAVPVIYIADVGTGAVTAHPVTGLPQNYLLPSTTNPDSIMMLSHSQDYDQANDMYGHLSYDPLHHWYYIFRLHRTLLNKPNGDRQEYEDKPLSIYVADSNFKVIKAVHVKDSHSYAWASFAYNGFLYLSRKTTDDAQPLIIDKFDFTK